MIAGYRYITCDISIPFDVDTEDTAIAIAIVRWSQVELGGSFCVWKEGGVFEPRLHPYLFPHTKRGADEVK